MWAGVMVIIAGITAVELAVWMLVVRPRLRARRAEAARAAEIAVGGDVVVSGAAGLVGLASGSGAQARAGHLVIGRDALVFVRRAPGLTLRVARERIDLVDTTRTHLGRATGHPLLRVAFRDEAGTADVVAFDVGRDTRPWEEALAAG